MADKNRVELAERGAVAFELKQLREICAHVVPIDSATAFSRDSLDIEPVLGAVGEGLEDDQRVSPMPVKIVRSASRVRRASPQRCTAIPPIKQKRQRLVSQNSWISSAAAISRLGASTLVPAREQALHLYQA